MTGTWLKKPGQAGAASIKRQRQLWWKLLSHDVHAHGGFSTGIQELLYFYLDHSFPFTDPGVVFHPYWDETPAVKPVRCYMTRDGKQDTDRASRLEAVAYSKPGGQALVLVARDAPDNYSGSATVEVRLDRQQLGLPAGELAGFTLESLGRKAVGKIEGDILSVPVNVDDYAAVIVRPREQ